MKIDKRLTAYIKVFPLPFAAILALSVIASLMLIFQAKIISILLDGVFLSHKSLQAVLPWLGFLLIIALIRSLSVWSGRITGQRFAARIKKHLRMQLVSSFLKKGPVHLTRNNQHNPSTIISDGIEALDSYFSDYLPQVILSALTPLLVLLFVFPADIISGFILLLTAPIIPVFMVLIGNLANRKSQRQWGFLTRMSTHFLDVLQGITTLKIFGKEHAQSAEIFEKSEQFRSATMNVLKIAFLSALVLEMAAMISTAVIAVEVGLRLLYDRMAFQQAIFLLILAPDFYQPMRQLGASYHAGLAGISAAEDIFKIMDQSRESDYNVSGSRISPVFSGIQFRDVNVTYPGRITPVLNQISFSIKRNGHYFIIGPSGAGKSTLFNLLLRFVDPVSGSILYSGSEIQRMNVSALRNQIIWVPQKPYLFHQSIAENLRFVNPLASDNALQEACDRAGLHKFIMSLKHGYQTFIGEHGARLSAGQAQRLALARAFLSKGELYLLDEPTSHMDTNLETRIWKTICEEVQDRTMLVITHKLHLIEPEDHILLLIDGKVVQQGIHAGLLEQEGPYRELITFQGERL